MRICKYWMIDLSMNYEEPCTNPFCNDKLYCGPLKRASCVNYRTSIQLESSMTSKNIIPVLEQVEIIKS